MFTIQYRFVFIADIEIVSLLYSQFYSKLYEFHNSLFIEILLNEFTLIRTITVCLTVIIFLLSSCCVDKDTNINKSINQSRCLKFKVSYNNDTEAG